MLDMAMRSSSFDCEVADDRAETPVIEARGIGREPAACSAQGGRAETQAPPLREESAVGKRPSITASPSTGWTIRFAGGSGGHDSGGKVFTATRRISEPRGSEHGLLGALRRWRVGGGSGRVAPMPSDGFAGVVPASSGAEAEQAETRRIG